MSSDVQKKRGATKHCAYGTCHSDSRYTQRPQMEGVFFIRFPRREKNPAKCLRWVRACSRQHFTDENVKKDTYICSLHFVGGKGPTDDHPDPIPANATKYEIARIAKKARSAPTHRARGESPSVSVSAPTTEPGAAALCTEDDHEIAEILLSFTRPGLTTEKQSDAARTCPEPEVLPDEESGMELEHENRSHGIDRQTQTSASTIATGVKEAVRLKLENDALKQQLKDTGAKLKTDALSVENIESDKKMYFYTGLTILQFFALWKFLGPAASCLSRVGRPRKYEEPSTKSRGARRKLSPKNELFLTLIRLRLGLLHQDLAFRFNVSVCTVNGIITTWLQFLYLQFNRLRPYMFPSRSKTQKHLPKSFQKFRNVRVILDATEFFTQSARNYEQQGNMYSSYKSHTTCKALIGISPAGAISFISDVYEGSISDKAILKESNLLDKLEKGDLVMVDRGFNVREMLLEKGADIVIPPFLGNRHSLTKQEEAQTRVIAKLRIHVERVIERMKKFKILKKIVPLNTLPTFSQTVFIVGCLVNFQKPIVK